MAAQARWGLTLKKSSGREVHFGAPIGLNQTLESRMQKLAVLAAAVVLAAVNVRAQGYPQVPADIMDE